MTERTCISLFVNNKIKQEGKHNRAPSLVDVGLATCCALVFEDPLGRFLATDTLHRPNFPPNCVVYKNLFAGAERKHKDGSMRNSLLAPFFATILVALLFGPFAPNAVSAQSTASGSASAPVEVAVLADPGPAADSLVNRFRSEVEALFSARRPVRMAVTQGGADWTPDVAAEAYRSAQDGGADAIVVIGPVALASACAASQAAASVPTIGVTTGSGLLVPDRTADRCTIVDPIGGPSTSMRAFRDLGSFSSVTVAVDARVVEHLPRARERVRRRGENAGLTARLVPVSSEVSDLTPLVASSGAVVFDHVDRMSRPK